MQELIYLIPIVFSMWTGMLISWSLMVIIGLYHIMYTVRLQGMNVRSDDKITALLCVGIVAILVNSMVFFPAWVSSMIDMLLVGNLWFTLFLVSVTTTNLSIWPLVFTGERIRVPHQTPVEVMEVA